MVGGRNGGELGFPKEIWFLPPTQPRAMERELRSSVSLWDQPSLISFRCPRMAFVTRLAALDLVDPGNWISG